MSSCPDLSALQREMHDRDGFVFIEKLQEDKGQEKVHVNVFIEYTIYCFT